MADMAAQSGAFGLPTGALNVPSGDSLPPGQNSHLSGDAQLPTGHQSQGGQPGANQLPSGPAYGMYGAHGLPTHPHMQPSWSEPMDGDIEEDDADEETLEWGHILTQSRTPCETQDGQRLCSLLKKPPPLKDLKESQKDIVLYQGVPDTAVPTRSRLDKQWHNVQAKSEAVMHLLVAAMDKSDKTKIVQAQAWVRSIHEDALQARRKIFTGRQSWKLDPRPDDNTTKLLSIEEQKKIRPQGKGKGKGTSNPNAQMTWKSPDWKKPEWQKPQQRWTPRPRPPSRRPRSQSRGKAPEQK